MMIIIITLNIVKALALIKTTSGGGGKGNPVIPGSIFMRIKN